MLTSYGILRRVDEVGRVVIPMSLRRKMGIEAREVLEIFVTGDNLVMNKYHHVCIFCGNTEDVREYKGKNICRMCLTEISKRVG